MDVRRPSSVVNNSFKGHLLLNYWLGFKQTWQYDPYITSLIIVQRFQSVAYLGPTGQNRFFERKTLKLFLSETTRPRAFIFGMWHHLRDLYQVIQIMLLGPNMGPPRGHMVNIGLYEETRKEPLYFSRLLPSLFKLCPWSQKWAHFRGYIGLYKINFFRAWSCHGHVTYQIKWNEAYNYMLANILPVHTSLVPWLGSTGHFFLMLHVKLTGMKQKTQCKPIFYPLIHTQSKDGVKR